MATVYPRNQYVLVQMDPEPDEAKTEGGIHLPDSMKGQINTKDPRGTVLAVGPGTPCPEAWGREGTHVSFGGEIPYAPILARVQRVTEDSEITVRLYLEPGDRVVLRAWTMQVYTSVGKESDRMILVDEKDILAVVEE